MNYDPLPLILLAAPFAPLVLYPLLGIPFVIGLSAWIEFRRWRGASVLALVALATCSHPDPARAAPCVALTLSGDAYLKSVLTRDEQQRGRALARKRKCSTKPVAEDTPNAVGETGARLFLDAIRSELTGPGAPRAGKPSKPGKAAAKGERRAKVKIGQRPTRTARKGRVLTKRVHVPRPKPAHAVPEPAPPREAAAPAATPAPEPKAHEPAEAQHHHAPAAATAASSAVDEEPDSIERSLPGHSTFVSVPRTDAPLPPAAPLPPQKPGTGKGSCDGWSDRWRWVCEKW